MLKTKMHSSRMRTVRSLTVSRGIRLGGCTAQPPPDVRHRPPDAAPPLDADPPPRGQNDKLRLRAVIIAS